jgi:hypothetical protein
MYSFTLDGKPGPGMLIHQGSLQEPSPDMKELAMGYKRGTTTIEGLSASIRHKLLGACMDLNISRWLIGACQDYAASTTNQNPVGDAGLLSTPRTPSIPPKVSHTNNTATKYQDDWIVDTGATAHFTGHISDFSDYIEITPRLGHGMNLYAVGLGAVHITIPVTDVTTQQIGERKITLHNVLFGPGLISNKARVTRLLSQRTAHTLADGTKPTFISSLESAIIHFGSYLIELDLEAHRNLLTLHSRTTHSNTVE